MSAMNAAICCGKRIMPKTVITAAHNRTVLISLPRTAHRFARCCCQNPTPMSATESPKSQGRNVVKKALAAPAPKAATKPSGRQQPIVATEVKIAASDAEKPVACLTCDLTRGLPALHGGPIRLGEAQFAWPPDTDGNSARKFLRSTVLPQRPVR